MTVPSANVFRLGQADHPLKRDTGTVFCLVIDDDLVNDVSVNKIRHSPSEILRSNAVHRGAHAEVRREQADFFVGEAGLEAVDEVDLGTDRPFRAGRGVFDGFNDERG